MDYEFKRRLLAPYWVDNMFAWCWRQNDMWVGPAILAHSGPGKANLAWLALDMHRPPDSYDPRTNEIYMWVVMDAHNTGVERIAAMYTLREFEYHIGDLIANCKSSPRSKQMLVFLQMLARRRLDA